MTKRKLKLYFKDESSSSKSLTIDYPKTDYTSEEIKESMDLIIKSKVLVTKNGPIATKTKAEIETIDKEDISLA